MEFGVPKEIRDLEMRVGLTPAGVTALVRAGHRVYVEREAGAGAGFSDDAYRYAGAELVYSAAEVYGRADAVVKVTRPTAPEHQHFRQGQMILAFFHLPVSSPDLPRVLVEKEITAIAYEMIQEDDNLLPVLMPMSEIAGRMAPIIAGQLLMTESGGRGTLLSGIPGVPPAAVVILGAGVLGLNAARAFLGCGAQVTVLDHNIRPLRRIDELCSGRVTTMMSSEYNIQRTVQFADVLVGAVLQPGRRAPVLVTREMLRSMRPGTALLDFSIDQGGCTETSRPTTLRAPTYVEEGVIHYCVPNLTASVARTTSHAITNAALPFLLQLENLSENLQEQPALSRGVNLLHGRFVHPQVAAALGKETDGESLGIFGMGKQA
jgi:alanine dehydrogenase